MDVARRHISQYILVEELDEADGVAAGAAAEALPEVFAGLIRNLSSCNGRLCDTCIEGLEEKEKRQVIQLLDTFIEKNRLKQQVMGE